jgi:hypothetical protein
MDSTMDRVESNVERMEQESRRRTGMSLFHWLTLGSVGASIALFAAGKKHAALFVGLWPPTFQALKAARRG